MKRQIRLRREYLFKKSSEQQNHIDAEKKAKLELAISTSSRIPDSLKGEEANLRASSKWEDNETKKVRTHIDDEYGHSRGNPLVCVTTSRDPSSKLKEFAKELRMLFPESKRVNRGQSTLSELVETCKSSNFTDIVVCTEHHGDPNGLIISHLPYGPTLYVSLSDCITRHNIGKDVTINASESMPNLIFHNMDSKLGLRVKDIFSHLFPISKPSSKRLITFYCDEDIIYFRHHICKARKRDFALHTDLNEVGPRFKIHPYRICLGTLDQKDGAEVEWALRSYTNFAKKKKLFSVEQN